MTARLWTWPVAALGVGTLAMPAAAAAVTVAVSVRYPAKGPGIALVSTPELPFRCARARGSRVCTAAVPRGTTLALRARTLSPAGSPGLSVMSFPIDAKAWGGACAGTPADVCRLRAIRALTVRIDTHDP